MAPQPEYMQSIEPSLTIITWLKSSFGSNALMHEITKERPWILLNTSICVLSKGLLDAEGISLNWLLKSDAVSLAQVDCADDKAPAPVTTLIPAVAQVTRICCACRCWLDDGRHRLHASQSASITGQRPRRRGANYDVAIRPQKRTSSSHQLTSHVDPASVLSKSGKQVHALSYVNRLPRPLTTAGCACGSCHLPGAIAGEDKQLQRSDGRRYNL